MYNVSEYNMKETFITESYLIFIHRLKQIFLDWKFQVSTLNTSLLWNSAWYFFLMLEIKVTETVIKSKHTISKNDKIKLTKIIYWEACIFQENFNLPSSFIWCLRSYQCVTITTHFTFIVHFELLSFTGLSMFYILGKN